MINYMELPLRGKEKAIFFLCIITAGLAVGILFYDSLAVSAVTAALLLMAMPQYKEKVVRKHQQELLMQFKDLLYSISASVSSTSPKMTKPAIYKPSLTLQIGSSRLQPAIVIG